MGFRTNRMHKRFINNQKAKKQNQKAKHLRAKKQKFPPVLRRYSKEEAFRHIKVDEELISTCLSIDIEKPTTSQLKAIKWALLGENINYRGAVDNRLTCISFVIPILQLIFKLPESDRKRFICCVICDDYEMSLHISLLFEDLARFLGITSDAIYLGENSNDIQAVPHHPHIFVATPKNLIKYFKLKNAVNFANIVKYLVFHEAEKFEENDIDALNENLFNVLENREDIQTFIFSKQMTNELDLRKRFGQNSYREIHHKDGEVVVGSPHTDTIKFFKCLIPGKKKHKASIKVKLLLYMIKKSSTNCVVFTNSIYKASLLYTVLASALSEYDVLKFDQKEEKDWSKAFEPKDKRAILVCADQAVKGFRIPISGMYISFDLICEKDFSFYRLSRAVMTPEAGVTRTFVQLVHDSELKNFQKILEHVFFELDKSKSAKDNKSKKKELEGRVYEYKWEACAFDLSEYKVQLDQLESSENTTYKKIEAREKPKPGKRRHREMNENPKREKPKRGKRRHWEMNENPKREKPKRGKRRRWEMNEKLKREKPKRGRWENN